MQHPSTRRTFIQIFPLAGISLIAACSDKPAPTPAPVAAPVAPPPAPAAAPAPVAEATPAAAPAAPATAAADAPMVDPKDPQAMTLGYVSDATQADKAKYKTYVAGSQCSTCALYQGKAGDAAGGCPLYPAKRVAAKGWCSAWAKKA